MAYAETTKNGVKFYGISLSTSVSYPDNNTAKIYWTASISFGNWYGWGVGLNIYVDGVKVQNGSGACTSRYQENVVKLSGSTDVSRGNSGKSVAIKAESVSQTVNGNGGVGAVTSCADSVSVAAVSVAIPPLVTNQKAVLSGSTVTISWQNNGSGASNPTGNYVDVKIDDKDWTNILNQKTTSTTYTVSANHRYQFRISSYNSAGQSTHQNTNMIYTAPVAPTIVNSASVIFPSAGSFSFACDKTDTLYPSEKIEWQYSTDGGYYWSDTQIASGTVVSVGSSDSSLNSFIMGMRDNSNCYVRARIYNYDNSIASDWSVAARIKVTLQPICLVNVPDGATIKAVYINKG